jgi:2-polyprenyl-3-methyl-5-hydroxy-6-metoxy-1,4-benzoquinol methylase
MAIDNELEAFYNKAHLTEASRKGYYDEKLEFITSNLKKFKKNNPLILDIACNDGGMTQKYGKYGKIMGIDINKKSVALCKKRGIPCLCTDVKGLTKKYKNHFDIVIAGDIIEHVFDTDEFLNNIYTVLKPGGILLLTTANVASLARRGMLLFGLNPFLEYSTILPNKEFNVGHIRYYTVGNMYQQMRHQNYKHVRIYGDKINILPYLSISVMQRNNIFQLHA